MAQMLTTPAFSLPSLITQLKKLMTGGDFNMVFDSGVGRLSTIGRQRNHKSC